MIITEVLKVDAQLLVQIAQVEEQIFTDPWSQNALESTVMQPHGNIWVIEEEGRVLAYLIFYIMGGEMEIARIAVLPQYRAKGYARELVSQFLSFVQEQQIEQVLLEVRSNNQSAIGLYKSQGFQNIGVRKNYYSNPLEDAVLMSYAFLPTDAI